MLCYTSHRFGRWMASTDGGEPNDADHRCRARMDLSRLPAQEGKCIGKTHV